MKCNNCGHENEKDIIFCKKCGERLESAQTKTQNTDEASTNSASDSNNQNSANNSDTKQNINENKSVDSSISPLKRSWYDITHTPKWFGKGILLGLINCVPILNFTTAGYAQKWGVEADIEKTAEMPKGFITSKTFLTGFFEFLTWFVWMIVWEIAAWLINDSLGIMPIIGLLVLLAVWVAKFFWQSITSLAAMKCAINCELGQSFNVKEIFTKWTKGWGQLFTSYFIPKLICVLIGVGFALILAAISIMTFSSSITTLIESLPNLLKSANAYTLAYTYMPLLSKIVAAFSVYILVGWIVSSFLSAFEKLIRYRAVGYWIEKYAKEWK